MIVAEGAATSDGWEAGLWGSASAAATPSPYGNGIIIGDFNGDGRDDFMMQDISNYSWLLGISDGSAFNVSPMKNGGGPFTAGWGYEYVADFDGDGDEELLAQLGGSSQWALVEHDERLGTKSTLVGLSFSPTATVALI